MFISIDNGMFLVDTRFRKSVGSVSDVVNFYKACGEEENILRYIRWLAKRYSKPTPICVVINDRFNYPCLKGIKILERYMV
jgi:hypothetical protein